MILPWASHRCTRESGVQETDSPLPRPCRQPPDAPCLCSDLPVSVWTQSQYHLRYEFQYRPLFNVISIFIWTSTFSEVKSMTNVNFSFQTFKSKRHPININIVVLLLFWPEHVSEAERCDAQLNITLFERALRSVVHGQSKRSVNVPLTLTAKPNPAQITRSH